MKSRSPLTRREYERRNPRAAARGDVATSPSFASTWGRSKVRLPDVVVQKTAEDMFNINLIRVRDEMEPYVLSGYNILPFLLMPV
jgi:hypothetical protein